MKHAIFLPHDEAFLLDVSRFEREASGPSFELVPDMSSAPLEDDFEAILRATGEQVTAYLSPSLGLGGVDTFVVGSKRYHAVDFLGWCRPLRRQKASHAIAVPMVPDSDLPPATQLYDFMVEEEAVDRASGREWL